MPLYEKHVFMLAVSSPHSAATKTEKHLFFVAKLPKALCHHKKGRVIFMQKNFNKTKTLVTVAVLIALNIVIVRFLSVQTEVIRISFGFIPTSLCSMLFGPWIGAVSAFMSDFLGMVINSKGLAYFPGFGISEALYGLTYGFFLFKRKKSFISIILCVLLQTIIIDVGLGTLWLHILYQNPVWVILSARSVSALVMLPIKILGIKYTWEMIGKRLYSQNVL